MQLLPSKAALAIAAVTEIALSTRTALSRRPIRGKTLATRLGLPERHLEPVLQALTRHGILKGMRGSRGGYALAREEGRITADEILRAAGTAAEMESTPIAESALLNTIMPALAQAEHAFSDALARVNVEDLAGSAAALQNSSGPHDHTGPRNSSRNQPLLVSHQEHSNADGVCQQHQDAECAQWTGTVWKEIGSR